MTDVEFRATAAQTLLDLLRSAFAADPDAVRALLAQRVRVNERLADHPRIQARLEPDGGCTLGVLGLLNGLCMPEQAVAGTYDDADDASLTGFCVVPYSRPPRDGEGVPADGPP